MDRRTIPNFLGTKKISPKNYNSDSFWTKKKIANWFCNRPLTPTHRPNSTEDKVPDKKDLYSFSSSVEEKIPDQKDIYDLTPSPADPFHTSGSEDSSFVPSSSEDEVRVRWFNGLTYNVHQKFGIN
jgi:hypothetical protein